MPHVAWETSYAEFNADFLHLMCRPDQLGVSGTMVAWHNDRLLGGLRGRLMDLSPWKTSLSRMSNIVEDLPSRTSSPSGLPFNAETVAVYLRMKGKVVWPQVALLQLDSSSSLESPEKVRERTWLHKNSDDMTGTT